MMPANVKLSKNELSLVCDAQFILTKNKIIEKVYVLYGALSESFAGILSKHSIPAEILNASPKIYKGEQYEGLPYIMLDQPRFFNKHDVFAIRCFFWWGNFFSISLHLSGSYMHMYKHNLLLLLKQNKTEGWYYCINENQWQQSFHPSNYIPVDNSFFQSKQSQSPRLFIKLAKKIPLTQWDDAYDFYEKTFSEILALLKL